MTIDTLKRILIFLVLCLVQSLVLNRIHLFACATPLIYVYFILLFPRNYPKWGLLLWSFALGLCVDMFANTPGMASASLTLIGALQPYVLELFLPRDADENLRPGLATLGTGKYLTYAAILLVGYCLVFFSLEALTFFNWLQWLECIGGSSLLTIVLVMTLESARR